VRDVPKEDEQAPNIDEPGRATIAQEKFLEVWHDQDADGSPFIRWGCAVGPPARALANTAVGGAGHVSLAQPALRDGFAPRRDLGLPSARRVVLRPQAGVDAERYWEVQNQETDRRMDRIVQGLDQPTLNAGRWEFLRRR
jgi:hypothetical protein